MTYQPKYPSVDQMTADIIAEARANRVDPNVALRVARHEGLKPGVWQSNYVYGAGHPKAGQREQSFTPWQMNVDSQKALGSQFRASTGLDPADPANWQAVNKFAMAHAAKNGWKDWMGAKAAGVGPMEGLNMSAVPPGVLNQGLDMANYQKPGTPMQMAMQGGIPGMAEQFQMAGAVPPTPMQQAMQQSPGSVDPNAPHLGFQGSNVTGQQDPNGGPDWGDAFMSLGAGLSSIDNPSGAAAIVAMMKGKGKRYSFQQQWDGSLAKVDNDTGNIEIVRGPNKDLMDHKSGVANEANATSQAIGAINGWGDMNAVAKEIKGDASLGKITGWQSYVPNMPGGEAKALQAKLDNFKSKGVFTVLQGLRDMSKTGGALGQVSNYENVLMEKAFGALEQAQGTADFQKALDLFIAQSERSMANVNKAYQEQYGRPLPGYQPISPEAPAAPVSTDDGSSGFKFIEAN